jgi:hypothetical protein
MQIQISSRQSSFDSANIHNRSYLIDNISPELNQGKPSSNTENRRKLTTSLRGAIIMGVKEILIKSTVRLRLYSSLVVLNRSGPHVLMIATEVQFMDVPNVINTAVRT